MSGKVSLLTSALKSWQCQHLTASLEWFQWHATGPTLLQSEQHCLSAAAPDPAKHQIRDRVNASFIHIFHAILGNAAWLAD